MIFFGDGLSSFAINHVVLLDTPWNVFWKLFTIIGKRFMKGAVIACICTIAGGVNVLVFF